MSDKWVLVPRTAVPIEWEKLTPPLPPIPRKVWDAMVERGAKGFAEADEFEWDNMPEGSQAEWFRLIGAALRAALGNPEVEENAG